MERNPVGEFGSKEWCEACAAWSVEQLEKADLPADLEWGFSEVYTHPPKRLMPEGRKICGYYIVIKDGKVTGGDGATEECLSIPGFHVEIEWASICNQSRSFYDNEGGQQRSADEKVLFGEIAAHLGQENPIGPGIMGKTVWPKEVAGALFTGDGMHNTAASMQTPSPEFADLPLTEMGVPVFSKMTEEQKKDFLKLCGFDV